MKLITKKVIFACLIAITAGFTVGGVFMPPLFAIVGISLTGAIAAGKAISDHEDLQEIPMAPPAVLMPALPAHVDVSHNLMQAMASPSMGPDEKKEDVDVITRNFSMHIQYKGAQHSPGGRELSPGSVDVTVHTHTPEGHSRDLRGSEVIRPPTL